MHYDEKNKDLIKDLFEKDEKLMYLNDKYASFGLIRYIFIFLLMAGIGSFLNVNSGKLELFFLFLIVVSVIVILITSILRGIYKRKIRNYLKDMNLL